MAKPDRRETRDEPNSDDSVKSLIEEYVTSTREPVGPHNVFQKTPDQSERAELRGREADLDRVALNESSAMTLYLVCVAAVLIAALALVFS